MRKKEWRVESGEVRGKRGMAGWVNWVWGKNNGARAGDCSRAVMGKRVITFYRGCRSGS